LRVGYGSYVDPASAATVDVFHVTVAGGGRFLAPAKRATKGKILTDDQRRTMPHAMLVDSVIPQ
jgi:hypothetical protein